MEDWHVSIERKLERLERNQTNSEGARGNQLSGEEQIQKILEAFTPVGTEVHGIQLRLDRMERMMLYLTGGEAASTISASPDLQPGIEKPGDGSFMLFSSANEEPAVGNEEDWFTNSEKEKQRSALEVSDHLEKAEQQREVAVEVTKYQDVINAPPESSGLEKPEQPVEVQPPLITVKNQTGGAAHQSGRIESGSKKEPYGVQSRLIEAENARKQKKGQEEKDGYHESQKKGSSTGLEKSMLESPSEPVAEKQTAAVINPTGREKDQIQQTDFTGRLVEPSISKFQETILGKARQSGFEFAISNGQLVFRQLATGIGCFRPEGEKSRCHGPAAVNRMPQRLQGKFVRSFTPEECNRWAYGLGFQYHYILLRYFVFEGWHVP